MGWRRSTTSACPARVSAEHEVIVYCKANPTVKVIKAIGLTFDKMRKERGIIMSK